MSLFLRFPGFRNKAVTISYDDGVFQDERLISIMRKYGMKGTFNIPSAYMDNDNPKWLPPEKAKNIYSGDDIEVAIHGAKHYNLTAVEPACAARDVLFDRERLEKHFGRVIRGMAYAFGKYNDRVVDVLKSCGIEYARTTVSTEAFALPADWLRMPATCHHKNPKLMELVDQFLKDKPGSFWGSGPKLFYLWGHSYEFDNDNNWDVFEKFCEKIGGRDDVYYATNGEIYRYVKAFESLRFSTDLEYVDNPSATDVYIDVIGNKVLVPAGCEVKISSLS